MSGSLSPTEFVTKAARGGLAEVQLAQLAQKQAQSPEVKQFARRMIADHSKANTELQSIARSKNLTLPKEPDIEHKAAMKLLEGKRGAEFDAAYMAEMDKDHQKTIALFEAASKLEDPQLQTFATRTLPVLQEHHQMVENIRPVNEAMR
jgi:putative membrane protein